MKLRAILFGALSSAYPAPQPDPTITVTVEPLLHLPVVAGATHFDLTLKGIAYREAGVFR